MPAIRYARLPALPPMLAILLALPGCTTMASNRLLDSVHQPVVEHSQYQLDLATGPDGLGAEERQRLDGWFGAVGLRYGDRVALDDPLGSAETRAQIATIAARYGLLIGPGAPMAAGMVTAGTVRVVVLRAYASVPHCPDLATRAESNFNNATSSNYGCATNSNLAAMVANPDDLLSGTTTQTISSADASARAIWQHQAAPLTGAGQLTKNATN